MSEKLTIKPVLEEFDLACWYPRQMGPQPCHIGVDLLTRIMWATYNPEIGNAVPMDVWHGHVRWYAIPPLRAGAATALMEDWEQLARRVCDGYQSIWDGQNYVARLSDDGYKAHEKLEALSVTMDYDPTDIIEMCPAYDWFYEVRDKVIGKANNELEVLADEWKADAEADGIYLMDDLLEQMKEWRDVAANGEIL